MGALPPSKKPPAGQGVRGVPPVNHYYEAQVAAKELAIVAVEKSDEDAAKEEAEEGAGAVDPGVECRVPTWTQVAALNSF